MSLNSLPGLFQKQDSGVQTLFEKTMYKHWQPMQWVNNDSNAMHHWTLLHHVAWQFTLSPHRMP